MRHPRIVRMDNQAFCLFSACNFAKYYGHPNRRCQPYCTVSMIRGHNAFSVQREISYMEGGRYTLVIATMVTSCPTSKRFVRESVSRGKTSPAQHSEKTDEFSTLYMRVRNRRGGVLERSAD